MHHYSLPIRVYYEDTDLGGIVYHSNYLKYFERARTEALRQLGFELLNLYHEQGVQFVVHSANLEFIQPARLDQLLYVRTCIENMGYASIMYQQSIHLQEKTTAPLCMAKIKLVCVNKDLKPCAIPEVLSREIKSDRKSIVN